MSVPKRMKVTCPNCKKVFETTVFGSLNTSYSPDVIETVINGERFDAKCPYCGFVANLEYDLLYHDMIHGAMIWVIHKDNPKYLKKIEEIRASQRPPHYVTRIVPDMNGLREKAACLASGKDDRIVELCKVFLVSQLNQQMPDFDIRNAFFTYQHDRNIVYFYDANGKEIGCDLDDKIYGTISSLFKKPLLQMEQRPYQIIDYNWASSFYENLPDEDEVEEILANQTDKTNVVDKSITADPTEVSNEKKALFCRKCGAKLLSDSLFCSYCGTKVVY